MFECNIENMCWNESEATHSHAMSLLYVSLQWTYSALILSFSLLSLFHCNCVLICHNDHWINLHEVVCVLIFERQSRFTWKREEEKKRESKQIVHCNETSQETFAWEWVCFRSFHNYFQCYIQHFHIIITLAIDCEMNHKISKIFISEEERTSCEPFSKGETLCLFALSVNNLTVC